MDDTHYSISEAGKLVGVESHVLRYWEDELQLNIQEMEKVTGTIRGFIFVYFRR